MAEFIAWADEFLGLEGRDYELGGADVYSAGCGFLHGYTPMASMISKGKANLFVWADELDPPVATNASGAPSSSRCVRWQRPTEKGWPRR